MALTYRLVKGSPLTFQEGDDNLGYLEGLALSGSSINVQSFATTGSNIFIGSQTISGSVNISQSIAIGDAQFLGSNDLVFGTGDSSFTDANLTGIRLNYPTGSLYYIEGISSSLNTLYKYAGNFTSSITANGYPISKYTFVLNNKNVITYNADPIFSTSSIISNNYTSSAISSYGIFALNSSGSTIDTINFGNGIYYQSRAVGNWDIITVSANKIIEQADGKIIIGGYIPVYSGSQVSNFFRINADGTLDTSFISNNTVGYSVKTMATQSDGKIVIIGYFHNILSGSYPYPARRIARFNTNGSIDTTFNPGAGIAANYYTAPQSITLQSDDKIILVGSGMSTYSGSSAINIARINTDGTLDSTFNTGTGFNNAAYYSAVQSDGKILVGGAFTTYSGSSANRIVRLNISGTVDSSFNSGVGFNNYISNIQIQADQKIILGGGFTSYSGSSYNYIIRLNTDGTIDNTFNIGSGFDGPISSQNSIVIDPDGKILVSGPFKKFNSVTLPNGIQIARLNTDGTLDTSFYPSNVYTSLSTAINGCITRLNNGNILVGGYSPGIYKGSSEVTRLYLSNPITGSIGLNLSEVTNITFQKTSSLPYINLGTGSLYKLWEGYIDDDPYITVNTPFPVKFLGRSFDKIYVTGQGYIMFDMYPASFGTRMPNNPLSSANLPPYPTIKVAAADLSLYKVYTGSDDSTFRLWVQERSVFQFGTPDRQYSYIFYKDREKVDLYIDNMVLNGSQAVSAISTGNKEVTTFNIYSGSAYALNIWNPEVTSSTIAIKEISGDLKTITAYGSASVSASLIDITPYSVILEKRIHPNASAKRSYSIYESQSLSRIKINSVTYNPSTNDTTIQLSSSLIENYTASTANVNFFGIESNNILDIKVNISSGSGSYIYDYQDTNIANFNAYNITASSVDIYRSSGSGIATQINLKRSDLIQDFRLLTASFSGSFYSSNNITSSLVFSSSYLPIGKSTTIAIGDHSYAVGLGIVSSGSYQYIFGKYNALNDTSSIFVIGGGTDSENRKSVFSVTSQGVVISGSVSISGSAMFSNYKQPSIAIENITASVDNQSTSSFSVFSSSLSLYEIKNTTQHVITSKFSASIEDQSFYRITGTMSQPSTASLSDMSAVKIDPVMYYTTRSQVQTALKVIPTFTGSFAHSSSVTNKIAEFGDSRNGTQVIIDDVISGSIYSINDISGLPVFEVLSNSSIKIYEYPDSVFEKSGSAIYLGTKNVNNYKVVIKSDLTIDKGLGLVSNTSQVSQSISGSYTASLYNIAFTNVSSSVYFKAVVSGYDTGSWDVVSGDITGIIKYTNNTASLVGTPIKYSGSNNNNVNFNLVAGGTSASLQIYGTGSGYYKFAATVTTQTF